MSSLLADLKGRRNTFQETLLGLEYSQPDDRAVDLFSKACVEEYLTSDREQFGYLFAQVFEPGVLEEVALLEGVPYASVNTLEYLPTARMAELGELAANAARLPVVTTVNVAAALVSISRFDLADRLLRSTDQRTSSPRESFEVAMLDFVVSNRRDDASNSPAAFDRMREAILTGQVPDDRAMDACTQAVVWYLKRRELPEDAFAWFLETGTALAREADRVEPAALSSWYRGLAMLPASKGEAAETRRYMEYAQEAAEVTLSRRPRAYEMHLMKTYFESSLKEHVYVTRDVARAEEAGRDLIALDPAWAPSHGELAEVHARFGDDERAAELYETAASLGPPYVRHHLFEAARCRERLGDDERALAHYVVLAELGGAAESVLAAGRDLAHRHGDPSVALFEAALRELE